MLKQITLSSVAELDSSRIATAFDQALRRCEADLKDRPAVRAARSVSLTITLKPDTDSTGELTSVSVAFDVKESIPKRSSRAYVAEMGRAGLHVNDLSPDDPNQLTLDDIKPLKKVAQ